MGGNEDTSSYDPWRGHLADARSALAQATRIVVSTGAGISAESGVPTFRGERGLWKSYRPEQLANPMAFARDPRLVWEWYHWRRQLVRSCAPNAGHRAIAHSMVRSARADDPERIRLITQNVDGLHARALAEAACEESAEAALLHGLEPITLHGSLFQLRCSDCDHLDRVDTIVDASTRASLPRCPECGGLCRPAVVWFGESLDEGVLQRAFEAASRCEVCLVVGNERAGGAGGEHSQGGSGQRCGADRGQPRLHSADSRGGPRATRSGRIGATDPLGPGLTRPGPEGPLSHALRRSTPRSRHHITSRLCASMVFRAAGLATVLLLVACVSAEVAWVGSQQPQPQVPTNEVQIFDREQDLPPGATTVAVLYLPGPGDVNSMTTVLDGLRKQAGEIGADAIVVREFTDPLTDDVLRDAYLGVPGDRRGRVLAVRLPS